MFLSKHKSGYYYVYFIDTFSNKRKSISCKTKKKSEALEFLLDFKHELAERNRSKVIPITLDKFFFNFLIHSSSIHTDKTTKVYKTTFKQIKKYLGLTSGSMQLSKLNHTIISDYIQFRYKTSSVYAARKDLINLSSAFNKAVDRNYMIENPCKKIKRIKIPEKQPKFFTEIEFHKLLSVIEDKQFRFLVEVAVNTGMRQMELITLEWEQVNFKDRIITLNNRSYITKGKKVRSIPLNLRALQILNEMEQLKTSNYVFTNCGAKLNPDYVTRTFKKYVRSVNINPQLNFHSLRHSFASWLVQKGVSIYHVSKLLGHADIKTTEIYAHVRTDDLRDSINILNI